MIFNKIFIFLRIFVLCVLFWSGWMLYRFSWTTEFSVNKFILSHCNLSGSCLANANVRDENTNTKSQFLWDEVRKDWLRQSNQLKSFLKLKYVSTFFHHRTTFMSEFMNLLWRRLSKSIASPIALHSKSSRCVSFFRDKFYVSIYYLSFTYFDLLIFLMFDEPF